MLEPHDHENEEVYVIMEGSGKGFFGRKNPVTVEKGMFFHLPANAMAATRAGTRSAATAT